jgi:predicted transposase YbfD/YdcC
VEVEEKTNEIPAVRDLLDIREVKGCVMTWDALNTQKETGAQVIRKGGDYVGALKGNQHDFYEDVKMYFDEVTLKELEKDEKRYMKTVDKEQRGVAIREYYLMEDISWLRTGRGLQALGVSGGP